MLMGRHRKTPRSMAMLTMDGGLNRWIKALFGMEECGLSQFERIMIPRYTSVVPDRSVTWTASSGARAPDGVNGMCTPPRRCVDNVGAPPHCDGCRWN